MTSKGRPLDEVMRADDERYERAIRLFDKAMDIIFLDDRTVATMREQEILRAANALRNNVESILRGDEPDID